MLLAVEQQVLERQAFSLQRLDHCLGLVGRDDRVLGPLEKSDRYRQAVCEVNRRPLYVEVAALGVRTNHTVKIPRFEFVRVLRQSLEIANAIITGTGLENIMERQRAQGRVAAGT